MDDDEEEIEVPITNDLEQRVAEAFAVFDPFQTKIIELKDVPSIIRGLGCCPTEAELQDIILSLETQKYPGSVHLVNFLPLVTDLFTQHKFLPPTPDKLLEAFRRLDPRGIGCLTKEELTNLMTTEGEPFTNDELEEMMEIAFDPLSKTINYEYYVNQLLYEPEGEKNVYTLADRIEAEKPPPPPPRKTMSEYLREAAQQAE
ncbi:dynein regulatory complex protein 8-like [Diorhabda sublineata]|uniref:dynein regulatory complex protein 8-like n=1 Tax=Diorhabda sublineata TaxID=1163346 RepID=UPI0024E17870|nr:dynein regulatory complex protein 8-like [Diorhabda sublineata]